MGDKGTKHRQEIGAQWMQPGPGPLSQFGLGPEEESILADVQGIVLFSDIQQPQPLLATISLILGYGDDSLKCLTCSKTNFIWENPAFPSAG